MDHDPGEYGSPESYDLYEDDIRDWWRIRSAFRWAVENEQALVDVRHALQAVSGL